MTKFTNTFQSTTLVHGTPEQAHKQFLETVWWGGGLPPFIPNTTGVVQPAKDASGVGGIRSVPGFVLEEIVDAKLGSFIKYRLKRKAIFLVSEHSGLVEFFPAGTDMTRVTWTISYTPLPLCHPIVYSMLSLIPVFLKSQYPRDCTPKALRGLSPGAWLLILLLAWYAFGVVGRINRIPSTGPLPPAPEYISILDKHRRDTPHLSEVVRKHTFLVIGGTGFTGSGIVDDLLARGAKNVHVLGRTIPPVLQYPYKPGKEGRYPLPNVKYFKGDVTDVSALKKAMDGVDVVIHTAACYGDPNFASIRGAAKTEKINYGGMENIWNAAKATGTVKQIHYTSSVDTVFTARGYSNASEVAPYIQHGDKESTYSVGQWAVGDQYARTKILAEKFLLAKDKEAGIRTVSLRPSGIYGPGESTNFVKALNPGYALGALPFYFDKEQTIDWTCLYNLVHAHILAIYKLDSEPDKVGGKAYFINDDYISNSANWKHFEPFLEKLGVLVPRLVWFPPASVPAFGWMLESFHHSVFEATGMDIWHPAFLTYKEGLKAVVTHTHSNERAKKDLGYKPVVSADECTAFAAEEFARRYGVSR